MTSRATMSRTEQDVMCASTRRPSRCATPVIRRYGTRSFRLRPGQCSPRVTIIHPRSPQQDQDPVTRARSSNPGYLPGGLQRPSIGQAHSTKAQRRQRAAHPKFHPSAGVTTVTWDLSGGRGPSGNSARGHAASVSDDRAYQHPQADEEQDRGRDPGRRKPLTTIALTRSTTPPPRKMSAVAYHVSKMTQCQGWRAEARLSSRAMRAVYPCRAGLVIRPDRHA